MTNISFSADALTVMFLQYEQAASTVYDLPLRQQNQRNPGNRRDKDTFESLHGIKSNYLLFKV